MAVDRTNILEQVLIAWRVHNNINLLLLKAVPAKGLLAVPSGSRGRDVARQFAHMHKVRVNWLRYNGVAVGKMPTFAARTTPPRARLRKALVNSGKEVEKFLRAKLEAGEPLRLFQGNPVRWMGYLISHESHHRGQIALALKQNGMQLPGKARGYHLWGKWVWGKG